jgi:GDPmannose 4,6-dehydratase
VKALIFGVSGQDGFYLRSLLAAKNIEVIGVSRSEGNWIKGNVADRETVDHLLKEHQPHYVFHLAANSTPRHEVLFENHETISTGTFNILEAAYKFSSHTKVFLAGSGLQFVNEGKPISENDPFEARDPYSVSRIQSVYAGRYYRSLGLKVYAGYFFNHDSPLRSERHINKRIALAVNRIARGSKEVIEVGDINVKKEFSFAGDVAEAVWTLVNQENYFEAVIGSGKAYSIKNWIETCFQLKGMNWEPYVTEKNDFVSQYEILVSDPRLINSLGWNIKIGIQQLASMMIGI